MTIILDSICEWLYMSGKEPKKIRDRPMEVLAVGISRSGTDSLQQALQLLGYDKVYHGWDVIQSPKEGWVKATIAKYRGTETFTKEDWDGLLGDCMVVSDSFAAAYAEELMDAYPDAKVILNTRDVDKWLVSYRNNIAVRVESTWVNILYCFCKELWLCKKSYIPIHEHMFRGNLEVHGKRAYREHSAMVRGMALKRGTKFLEYDIQEGWEPLCKFLEKPIPTAPVPNTNTAAQFGPRFDGILAERHHRALRNLMFSVVTVTGICAYASWGLWARYARR